MGVVLPPYWSIKALCQSLMFRCQDDACLTFWEFDHLVPIECGGDNDLKNIWPELRVGPWNAWDKDRLEEACGKDIQSESMTVAQAQGIFLAPADWRVGYRRVFGSAPADAN